MATSTSPTGSGQNSSRGARFGQTRWSVVLAAGHASSPNAQAALEELCRAYWPPIYAFVRRRGHGPEEAKDLTQEFFLQLLQQNSLAGVDLGGRPSSRV